MSAPKRKRVVLSVKNKCDIIESMKRGESGSSLAKKYNVGASTISEIKKNSETIMKFAAIVERDGLSYDRKTMKSADNADLESAVYGWYLHRKFLGEPITGPLLCEKAVEFNRELNGDPDFKASSGWLFRFKSRHGIGLRDVEINDATVVKTRWKSLRDRFTREKRDYQHRMVENGAWGDEAPPPTWRLYYEIASLLDKSTEYQSAFSIVEVKEEMEESEATSTVDEEQMSDLYGACSNASASEEIEEILPLPSVSYQTVTLEGPPHRRKRKAEEVEPRIVAVMDNVECTVSKTNDAETKLTETHDDAYFYGQCLISRFRALTRQQFRDARMEIERILYFIESDSPNCNKD